MQEERRNSARSVAGPVPSAIMGFDYRLRLRRRRRRRTRRTRPRRQSTRPAWLDVVGHRVDKSFEIMSRVQLNAFVYSPPTRISHINIGYRARDRACTREPLDAGQGMPGRKGGVKKKKKSGKKIHMYIIVLINKRGLSLLADTRRRVVFVLRR